MSPGSPQGDAEPLPTPSSPVAAPVADTESSTPAAPDVEALIGELKASLASSQTLLSTQATRLSQLTDIETELAQLKDQYAFLAAAKEAVEKQLQEQTSRREAAEENVEMLRGQVEQARRGVGILQKQEKERKRLSLLPPGSGTGLGLSTEPEEVLMDKNDRTSKRASMLVGRGHRRTSSHSEQGDGLHVATGAGGLTSPNLGAPRVGGLRELRLGSGNGPVTGSNTVSSPTGTHAADESSSTAGPPLLAQRSTSSTAAQAAVTASPIVDLGSDHGSPTRDEEKKLRAELADVRARLAESEESREASEACLKALREFMAAGGQEGGAAEADLLKTMRLPPLPTDKEADDATANQAGGKKASAGGWPFKLWKQGPASPSLSTAVEPPATPGERFSPPASVRSSMTPKVSPMPTPGDLPTEGVVSAIPASSTPLGNFVSSWTKSTADANAGAKPAGPARAISSFFSRKKDEAKDKDLPAPPEEMEQHETEGQNADTATEGLEPSAPIAEQPTAAEEDAPKDEPAHDASQRTEGIAESVEGTEEKSQDEVKKDDL